MRIRPAAILSLLALSVVAAADERKDTPDPVLVEMQTKLQAELKDLVPPPKFEVPKSYNGKSLIMRHKTREYLVYPSNKSGRIAPEPRKEEGPDNEGIYLGIHVEPQGQVNQAVVPQTINAKYWMTYLNQLPTSDPEKQIYFGLSYRGNTDKDVIERIGKVLGQKWPIIPDRKRLTPEPELIELSGKFTRPGKWSPQLELIPAGQVRRIDLGGELLEPFKGGEYLRVKGVMQSRLHRGSTEKNLSPFPPQWILQLEVTEVEVLDHPQDVLKPDRLKQQNP